MDATRLIFDTPIISAKLISYFTSGGGVQKNISIKENETKKEVLKSTAENSARKNVGKRP